MRQNFSTLIHMMKVQNTKNSESIALYIVGDHYLTYLSMNNKKNGSHAIFADAITIRLAQRTIKAFEVLISPFNPSH